MDKIKVKDMTRCSTFIGLLISLLKTGKSVTWNSDTTIANATHLLYNGIPIPLKVEIKLMPYFRVNFVIGENCLTFYIVHPYDDDDDDTKLEAHFDSLTPYNGECDKRVIPAYYLDIVDRIRVACRVFRCELIDYAKTHQSMIFNGVSMF